MLINNLQYFEIFNDIKSKIKTAQYKATVAVNTELLLLYWSIGNIILDNIEWGNKFIDNLAQDISIEFPNVQGFGVRNLKYMRKFAQEYTDIEFVQRVVAQITWRNNIVLMEKIKDLEVRKWYIEKTLENGWNKTVLIHQIESNLYKRQQATIKTNNFANMLPSPQSELAQETMKDPYIFDFLGLQEGVIERKIEDELVKNITQLLLELGTGFAFLGRQYHLEVGGDDFYLDLLFYNLKLRCYVVIELKTGKFKPEYVGKLNFYLSAVDDVLKTDLDNPSIGLLLCKEKNKVVAEYALKDMTKPIGISEYKLLECLPIEFENTLPSIEDIENRIKNENSLTDNDEKGD